MIPGARRIKGPRGIDERRVFVANFADALGTGVFLPLSVIYLTRIVGLPAVHVGVGLTIAGSVAIAGVPASGALLDRFDARKILLACYGASAIGFAAYAAVSSFASFVVVALVVQISGRMAGPARSVVVLGVTAAKERVIGLARQQRLRNFGYGLGGLLAAAILLGRSKALFDCVLAANAASYLVAGAFVLRLPPIRPLHHDDDTVGFRDLLRDRTYIGLALLNTLINLHDSALQVAMPLWIATRTSAPLALTGLLFTLNTILVVALQVRAARKVTSARGVDASYRTAARAFAIACAAFAFAAGVPPLAAIVLLVVGLAALTTGELENTAGESFLPVELSPTSLRGRYLSVYKSSMAVQQAIGPALVTALITGLGAVGWLAIGLLLTAGTLASRKLAAHATFAPTKGTAAICGRPAVCPSNCPTFPAPERFHPCQRRTMLPWRGTGRG